MGIVEDYLALQGKCNDALDSAEMWERKWRKAELARVKAEAMVERWKRVAMRLAGGQDDPAWDGPTDADVDIEDYEAAMGVEP